MSLFAGQEERHGHRQTDLWTRRGKESVGQTERAALIHAHHLHAIPLAVCSRELIKQIARAKLPYGNRELTLALCDNLE